MPTLELLWIESLTDHGRAPAEPPDTTLEEAARRNAAPVSSLPPGLRVGKWQAAVGAPWRHRLTGCGTA